MSRDGHADIRAGLLPDQIRQLIGYGRIRIIRHFCLVFFLGQLCILFGDRPLRHCQDRKALLRAVPLLNGCTHLVDVIRDLRNQHDIRSACDARMECQPSYLMSHDLNDEYPVVGCCCGMDAVDALRRNVHGALKAKRHICSPDIIVDRLGKMNDIQTLLAQKIRRFLGSVAAQNDQAVQIQLLIGLLHGLHLVQAVLVRRPHILKRLSGASQDRPSLGQDTCKISAGHVPVFIIDQSLISFLDPVDLHVSAQFVIKPLCHSSHGRIQCLAVATARQ